MATGIRDYQAGDRVTWIHWKSFARTQTLMTKEFEDRRSQELLLVLDGRPSETFEEQVDLAASILKEASSHQAGIGFLTTGSEQSLFPFIQSEEQFQRALIHLSKNKAFRRCINSNVESNWNEFRSGGSIIVITAKPDWTFIQSVVLNAKSARSIICLTVVKRDNSYRNHWPNDIRLAKSRES